MQILENVKALLGQKQQKGNDSNEIHQKDEQGPITDNGNVQEEGDAVPVISEESPELPKEPSGEEVTPETESSDKPDKAEQETAIYPDLSKILEPITKMAEDITRIKELVSSENRELLSTLDNRQMRLEQVIQTTQEDRYRKDRIKLINRCIYLADLIRKSLYDYSAMDVSPEKAIEFLEKQLSALLVAIDVTLQQESIQIIQDGRQGDNFRPETQESVDTIPTDNPELDGRVYMSLNPGYVWTLPYILKAKLTEKGDEIKSYRFLLRPEQVITYKLSK